MPSLTLSRAEALRETNQRLRHWLDCMITQRGQLTAATPDRITALLSELSRAGAELRAQPIPATGTDPELDRELDRYRGNVQQLREILPSVHSQLLVERARLEAQRARVQSAAEWARASRQTL
jgi:hypothetical protein